MYTHSFLICRHEVNKATFNSSLDLINEAFLRIRITSKDIIKMIKHIFRVLLQCVELFDNVPPEFSLVYSYLENWCNKVLRHPFGDCPNNFYKNEAESEMKVKSCSSGRG